MIRKSTREVSIDTLQATAVDKVNQKLIDSNTTPSIDITCKKAEKVEVLILSLDKNEVLRYGERPFNGFPCEQPMAHIFMIQELSLRTWKDIVNAFLNNYLYNAAANLEIEMESMLRYQVDDLTMEKRDEHHGSGEPSKVNEAGTGSSISASIDSTASTTDDSTLKSIDLSSCDPTSDGDREITMEDFLELEEFLKLEDGEKLGDLDSSREVTILRQGLPSIDTNLMRSIDNYPTSSINARPTSSRHPPDSIELHPPDCIDRHPWLDELPRYIVELEQVKEKMYKSKASHLVVPKHQRPHIWTEEAAGFHKRVKRIHDPVKIVVPCDVFEAESPIPPDKSIQLSSYSGVFDDHICVEASRRRGLRFRGEVDNGPTKAVLIDTNKPSSIDITNSPSIDTSRESDQNKKSRVRSRCFSQPFAKLRALLIAEMKDKGQ
ncbi:hypothetical protein F2Q69_00046229 [Brassica cretica]|uniref:Uncharacterized protein n=1 Tax=Brassica cretica TaxID=69181 RepID=A0A8S9PUV8_BRACR|nr:hypothetical protein F2Q69_00046229 [Brassica cretica]